MSFKAVWPPIPDAYINTGIEDMEFPIKKQKKEEMEFIFDFQVISKHKKISLRVYAITKAVEAGVVLNI